MNLSISQKFAAQRLTKQQMSQVKGGGLFMCTFTTPTGTYTQYVVAEDKATAENMIESNKDANIIGNANCTASLYDGPNL